MKINAEPNHFIVTPVENNWFKSKVKIHQVDGSESDAITLSSYRWKITTLFLRLFGFEYADLKVGKETYYLSLKEIKEPFEKAEAETSDDAKCTQLFREMFNPQSTIKKVKPYSDLGRKALAFASSKINQDTTPCKFVRLGASHFIQPKNQEIALLTTLYDNTEDKFNQLCKTTKNPLQNEQVMQLADELIKISYAISNLTLDELELFTKEDWNRCQVLTGQETCHYKTFFYCTIEYHHIRNMYNEANLTPLFYNTDTVQNSWNQLYNDYCQRRQLYLDQSELEDRDKRFTNWTQKDTGITSYKPKPDTLPS